MSTYKERLKLTCKKTCCAWSYIVHAIVLLNVDTIKIVMLGLKSSNCTETKELPIHFCKLLLDLNTYRAMWNNGKSYVLLVHLFLQKSERGQFILRMWHLADLKYLMFDVVLISISCVFYVNYFLSSTDNAIRVLIM